MREMSENESNGSALEALLAMPYKPIRLSKERLSKPALTKPYIWIIVLLWCILVNLVSPTYNKASLSFLHVLPRDS